MERNKTSINTLKVLCIGTATMAFFACTQVSNQNKAEFSYVEVVGTAEKEVEPDIFYLRFELENNSANKNDINLLEQRMLAVLQSLNIDTKSDLTVTGMSGDSYWWRKYKKYQYKRYLLKAYSLDLVNKTCDKLDSLKIDYSLSRVDYSEIDELKKEVQQEAVKKARQKAENLLSGENKRIGELIYLQEQETTDNNSFYRNYGDAVCESVGNGIASYDSPAFNKMKVSYSIVARFSIK